MMDGVSESLSTKVKKVVKVVERQSSGAVVDTVDEEAVARVEACKKEMAVSYKLRKRKGKGKERDQD